jgi:hypothetical protein
LGCEETRLAVMDPSIDIKKIKLGFFSPQINVFYGQGTAM